MARAAFDHGELRARHQAQHLRRLGEVAALELGHAAATRIDDPGLDPVAGQDKAARLADTRIVVVDEARRIEHRPAAVRRRLGVDRGRGLLGPQGKGLAVELGQHRLQGRAGEGVAGVAGPVGQARRQRRQLAVAVGLAELGTQPRALALRELGCARAA